MKAQKKEQTFIIKILDRKYSTWQGSILWAEKNKEQHFRSALELLKLIDGVLMESEEETEGGSHEK